ncbi:hypothetical protein AB1Y20_020029 [Prymnesium parvum]|uniref:Tubulin-specific chaperone A n=1 Tax=Prymnesium parvum TaxID=97485 RepID=A0AB34JW59_PRYPA|mmetsp:Transcript_25837/g.59085  ORF Transcript_25837/g.59085 Transcript_25837/m.59085 type:complete len:119 (-) Transcript_25837:114-470(-)
MNNNFLKELKIRTNSCARTIKDLEYSKKEIARQEERIRQYKEDPERDDHDVKKQIEVLSELHAGVPTEVDQLDKYLSLLREALEENKEDADILATEEYQKAVSVEKQGAEVLEQYRPS